MLTRNSAQMPSKSLLDLEADSSSIGHIGLHRSITRASLLDNSTVDKLHFLNAHAICISLPGVMCHDVCLYR